MLSENSEADLHADILKVGHHGSKNSTMPDFLAAVHPRTCPEPTTHQALRQLQAPDQEKKTEQQ
jgi:hypothetical protein